MNQTPKPELSTEEDIRTLVDTFYDKVNKDELLGPIFNDVVQVNWQHHLPNMYQFWSSVLFGTAVYKGRPFPKHFGLPIDRTHFARWVQLFTQTIDELFAGPMADHAKERAISIANIFQMKMGLWAAPLVKP